MEYITTTLSNLLQQTAFLNLTFGNIVMIFVALIFLYLAIGKGFEPLLLLPISFGMLLVNIYPDIMRSIEDSSNGVGGLLHYFYLLDEWSILPSLIFMGVGAMTDFGPLIANPKSFLLGAAAQFGIYGAYFMAIFMGFNDKAAAAISIIGGADGPTSIFLAGKLGQTSTYGSVTMVIEGVNMVAGDELIIDTEHMTVTLNGANIIDRVSDDSAFFKLQPGENDIIVEGGTTADVKILWKDRWL